MKNIYSALIVSLVIGIILFAGVCFFQKTFSPIKNGLYLRYETTLYSGKDRLVSAQELRFAKIDKKHYKVDIQLTGFLKNKQTYIVDRYFIDGNGICLSGPTAAVLWTAPYLLKVGNQLPAGEVIKYAIWNGYPVAVIQDPALANCYGFYDRRTGIQLVYLNCFSSQKLFTVIKKNNIVRSKIFPIF